MNIPAYDNAFRRIGSTIFAPKLKEMINHKDYIEANDAKKLRLIRAITSSAAAETRNIIMEYHPQLEMQRLVRRLSSAEMREIFDEMKSKEGGKEYVERLNNMNIYENLEVVTKILSFSKAIKNRWNKIKEENDGLRAEKSLALKQTRLGK